MGDLKKIAIAINQQRDNSKLTQWIILSLEHSFVKAILPDVDSGGFGMPRFSYAKSFSSNTRS